MALLQAVLDTSAFVDWCRRDKPRTHDYIQRWDILYRHCEAEFCHRRREAFARYYGKSIATASSTDLCLVERYTACVNFTSADDGVIRHVCDILPIIIGSQLDRRIRYHFWQGDRSQWYEDELKIGLLIQNKNFYHFTTTMATNPKVAHIYRRSNKLHCLDSRVYYYDNNFRGNMFYFEQSLLLIKCNHCLRADHPQTGNAAPASGCQGPMCIVVEELFLRNCFKQDHLLIRRLCSVSQSASVTPDCCEKDGTDGHHHDAAIPIILRYLQQRDKQGIGLLIEGSSEPIGPGSPRSLNDLLARFGTCPAFFAHFSSASPVSDVLFEEDLACYLYQDQHVDSDSSTLTGHAVAHQKILPHDRIHIRLTNERDLTSLLLCEAKASTLSDDFINSILTKDKTGRPNIFWRIDNMDEFRRISDACFPRWTRGTHDLFSLGHHHGYYDQLFVLYSYMREVMLRNEDIDQLCNKCVFDGAYLYNKLMRQMKEYLCHRCGSHDLNSDWIDTLVSRYRALAHTANLYMLISSKTNIRVDMANDLKRSLKLSIKREKMQQTDYSMAMTSSDVRDNGSTLMNGASLMLPATASTSAMAAKLSFGRTTLCPQATIDLSDHPAASSLSAKRRKLSDGHLIAHPETAAVIDQVAEVKTNLDFETNDKCDFVLKRYRFGKFRHLYTGVYPEKEKMTIMVASCNRDDINARQLIAYDSQHLLQNVASAHFTDLEFVLEQIKRPRVTNQQNSSKCALMPRESTRFLSAYNIGNMSVAGRTMNVCARNSITFFVHSHRELSSRYYQWLSCIYRRLTTHAPSSHHCQQHRILKCNHCFLRLMINEVPCANFLIDQHYEFTLFVLTKTWWPAVQFYRKTSHIINVTLISGVIVIPMMMVFDDEPMPRIDHQAVNALRYDCWLFCQHCQLYFPRFALDRASNLFFIDNERAAQWRAFSHQYVNEHQSFLLNDGGIQRCQQHTWFSSNDLHYYESMLSRQSFSGGNESLTFYVQSLTTPFFYEVACHGLFLNSKFVDATDISKLTVSINASKRRLRLRSAMFSDRLETLMDQNARMYVDNNPSTVGLTDQFQEPLNEIVGVPGQNLFRCCFMFGDFKGRNCEDAYIFDRGSRPRLVNTIQLKVNYYRHDNSVIDTSRLRFHFMPNVSIHASCGCTFFFGYLISPCRLSFGSTFVHVKTVRTAGLWIYKFYYTNWSSYLRDGELIFSGQQGGDGTDHNGLRFQSPSESTEPVASPPRDGPRITFEQRRVTDARRNQPLRKKKSSSDISTLSGGNRIIYEYTSVSANGRIQIEMQMTSRQLRFVVILRAVRTIQKLQNNCGQKGVTSYEDLSDLYTARGGRVHVIVSLYSMNGRQLLSQLLEQYSNAGTAYSYRDSLPLMPVYSKKRQGQQVGFAGYGEFFFSCDSPHDNIIVSSPNFGNNAMRMCNMTYFAAIGNNLSTWIANRSADHVNYRNNPINGMPLNVYHCLTVYHYYSRQLYPRSLLIREARKRFRDWVEMRRRGVDAQLPLSLSLR